MPAYAGRWNDRGPGAAAISETVDTLYREHAPRLVASLAKAFGAQRLDLIESGVQEAFIAALAWTEPPENPAAWLRTVARRKVLDGIRRAAWIVDDEIEAEAEPARDEERELLDMLFVCCHRALPVESAVVLSLRTLCGFSIAALARAFLAEDAAIDKRLSRARQTLRDEKAEPVPDLDSVLRVLYVLFLEGYSLHAGEEQIDRELCATAIRLNQRLLASPHATPAAHALQALFLLQAARFDARVVDGELVPLHLQDRSRWDRGLIARGMTELAASASGDALTPYHLEAAIASLHALAPSYEATDWPQIVAMYDRLLAAQPSPVVALQRAIAVGRAHGPRRGLKELDAIGDARLADSAVREAAEADLKERLGDRRGALAAYRRALDLVGTEPERRFIEAKIAELGGN